MEYLGLFLLLLRFYFDCAYMFLQYTMMRTTAFLSKSCIKWTKFNVNAFSTNFNSEIDYFKVLGIPSTANQDEIRLAYFNKAKQFHPDINPSYQQKFKQINQAYKVLGDPDIRRQYQKLYENISQKNKEDVEQKLRKSQKYDPVQDLYRINMAYLKSKMFVKSHHYDFQKFLKQKHKRQNQEDQQENNDKLVRYILMGSMVLTTLIAGEMVWKYMDRNRSART